ncbi:MULTISPECIES: hypothetical protein [Pseudonocardia]|uniref:DUF559 domain-containing protein n=2 Tax=Pseudonocardia TaxID=1847 RepID=A0A1Y2N4L0_PSEAH|nr:MULTISPECIES: hypothetical protein [Pseudonocardia]OSY42405.1 hypothetical protein BG845_01325 [Pseudonocardia autotrophica]TDN75925.1 hypothetical protein C8E95_5110 [Pseudonocardia autotrophica]BBF99897.1 hypothetical protein Pdca_11070 [Pseudonocardia autotrophica]GEC28886.1 hypothetical protein PSA01_59150 [Pseudonocardia saturnea]
MNRNPVITAPAGPTAAAPGDRPPTPAATPAGRRTPAPLDRLIAAQDGLVTRAQALAHGLSRDAVDRRLATRCWEPVHPRVYRDPARPGSERARIRAAVLWAGEGAVLTGAAAAWCWGLLATAPGHITVTVPRSRAPRPRDGIRVRRRDLAPADVSTHAGMAVAAPALAVLEAVLDPGIPGAALLERTLSGPGPDLAALTAAHARNLGAHGSAEIGRLLTVTSRQAAERALHRLRVLLVHDRIRGWRCGHETAGLVLALAFPGAGLAVEIDGEAGRGWRKAVLRRHGWRVLDLDPAEPWLRPAATLAALRLALSDRPGGPGGAAARRLAG